MNISAYPFMISAGRDVEYKPTMLPSFISDADRYFLNARYPQSLLSENKIYRRFITLSNGEEWVSLHRTYETSTKDNRGRKIVRTEGFFVSPSDVHNVDISQTTFGRLKDDLQPHFDEVQSRPSGRKYKIEPSISGYTIDLIESQKGGLVQELDHFSIKDAVKKKTVQPKHLPRSPSTSGISFSKVVVVTLGVAAVAGLSWVLMEQLRNKSSEQIAPLR